MTKIKHPKLGLAPLDLRAQDHYEEMLTVSDAAQPIRITSKISYFSATPMFEYKALSLCSTKSQTAVSIINRISSRYQ